MRGPLTAAAMEAIEPASDGLVEAIAKVTRLNPESPESAFAMLGQREVFPDLCAFHPSLLTAITLCWSRH